MEHRQTSGKIDQKVWMLLSCAWIAIAASQVITFGYGMMMPGIMQDMGVSTDVMGRIGGMASLVTVLLTIPGTLIGIKLNPRYSVPLSALGMAVGLFLFSQSTTMPMLYLSRMIAASFSNLTTVCLVATKLRGVPAGKMTQINGIENFIGPVGQVIATLAMAQFLMLVGGWRSVYATIAAVMTIAAVLYFAVWGNGQWVGPSAQTPGSKTGDTTTAIAALKEAWSNKVVWLTSLAWPGSTIVWIAMFYFWPTYATTELGITLKQAGMVLSMIPIFSAIASLTSPLIANKLGYDKPLIWPWGLVLPVCYYMMTIFTSVPLLCVFSALAGYGAYCFVPLAFTNIYKLGMSSKAVTVGTSTILTFVAVGSAISGTVIGALTTTFGLKNAIAISCLSPLWFAALMLFVPELGRKKMEQLAAARAAAKT